MSRADVKVGLGARAYDILVEPGLLAECGKLLADVLNPPRKLALITDEAVGALYEASVRERLESAGFEVAVIEMPAGEHSKSLNSADRIYSDLLEFGLDRGSAIVALGGGVIGDLAGFVAGTYMRGISFVQIPTSLLAQVDSSVGGKTAVNHPQAKNIIGVFHQPRLVIIDPNVLDSLPPREFRAGLAEIIKYALIAGGSLFDRVEEGLPFSDDKAALVSVIVQSCAYKATVVEEDERDDGRRAVLNYGHTIGHAIEALAGYSRYNHGEAVAVGMVGAALIGARLGLLTEREVELHRQLVEAAGLPLRVEGLSSRAIFDRLRLDKKRAGGRDRFVLLNGLGRPEVRDVDSQLILDVIEELSGG